MNPSCTGPEGSWLFTGLVLRFTVLGFLFVAALTGLLGRGSQGISGGRSILEDPDKEEIGVARVAGRFVLSLVTVLGLVTSGMVADPYMCGFDDFIRFLPALAFELPYQDKKGFIC